MHEKKEPDLQQVNVVACQQISAEAAAVERHQVEAAEMDEMWSFVGKKAQQRWLWHAIAPTRGVIWASVGGVHEDEVFGQWKEY
jgi:insertion element IS1 protein InsB